MTAILRVGGVPEHFNSPWHQAIEEGAFARAGLQVEFILYPTGTGAMCNDLRAGELDLAVVLTEGILSDMLRHGGTRLIGAYVPSPLVWGIHVAAHSPLKSLSELHGKTFAISRFGSGSHLMAMLFALEQGWHPREALEFFVAGGIDPLEKAVCDGSASAFLWEKYTTAPRIASGHLKRLGEFPTPWPSFVIAAREELIASASQNLRALLDVLYTQTQKFMAAPEKSVAYASQRYGLDPVQTQEWFESVFWATEAQISVSMLQEVLDSLKRVGILEGDLPEPDSLIARL